MDKNEMTYGFKFSVGLMHNVILIENNINESKIEQMSYAVNFC